MKVQAAEFQELELVVPVFVYLADSPCFEVSTVVEFNTPALLHNMRRVYGGAGM